MPMRPKVLVCAAALDLQMPILLSPAQILAMEKLAARQCDWGGPNRPATLILTSRTSFGRGEDASRPGRLAKGDRDRCTAVLPDLRRGLSAGKALAPQLCADWQALRGTNLPEALGITEVSTYLSGSPGRPVLIGTIGYAQVGRRIALLGDDGQPIAPGQPGQMSVHLSDPELLLGYLDLPDETDARFSGAWFLTGDGAHQRPDGAFVCLGRREDLINAGGIRVAPIDVEEALPAVPGLSECAVTEVAVKSGTQVIAAFHTVGLPLDDIALSAHFAGLLAPCKCPRLFFHLATMPRAANSKLNRRTLQGPPPLSSEHDQS